jgi:nucleotide-binding universal stress UspA family protein
MPIIESSTGLALDRILMATDFTEASEPALEYAQMLAKRFSSRLVLLHVVDLSIATHSEAAVVGRPIAEMRQAGIENMECAIIAMRKAGVNVTHQILESHNPPEVIVRLADQIKANLIVLGTHARHGLNRFIMGSCAEGVIRHANCPVLTVGPHAKKPNGSFSQIVFATDLGHDAATKAAVALTIGEDSNARIHLCYALEGTVTNMARTLESELKSEEALRKLVPRGVYERCETDCAVDHADAAPHILQLAQNTHADLIVMGARRSPHWFGTLSEGIVGRVLSRAESPVMTVCTG